MKRSRPLSLLVCACLGVVACDTPSYREVGAAQLALDHAGITLEHGDELRVSLPGTADNKEQALTRLAITNTGTAPLHVREVTIEGEASAVFRAALVEPRSDGTLLIPGGESRGWIEIFYKAGASGSLPGPGELVIRTNRTATEDKERRLTIVTDDRAAHLETMPTTVDMGALPLGQVGERPLRLLNTGTSPLTITALELNGARAFSLLQEESSLVNGEDGERVTLSPPLVVAAGSSMVTRVRYHPLDIQASRADLLIFSGASPDGHVVPLSANTNAPCIRLNPSTVHFGGKVPGTSAVVEVEILSCSEEPLVLTKAAIQEDHDDAFALDAITVEGHTVSLPITLGVNEAALAVLSFAPPSLSRHEAATGLVPFEGALALGTNALTGESSVPLRGFGVETECPTPVIVVREGEEVVPQTRLHLDGTQSFGPVPVASYEWAVDEPDGSHSVLLPSAAAPEVEFQANVAGLYTFRLRVHDANGVSCGDQAVAQVMVAPDDALHIELLWSTPTDWDLVDEGPEAGTDLDLHFVHPYAAGLDIDGDGSLDGYFDDPFDCFWNNPSPAWGSMNPQAGDDPRLDRDDTDGTGPENVNLDSPQDGANYRVGVHHWDDHGFGPSYATLRVYIRGALAYERTDIKLMPGELWDALTIAWPSGEVTAKGGEGNAPLVYPGIYPDDMAYP